MRVATSRIPGLVLTDHEFEVPLDYARPDGERITVFAREVAAPSRERDDLPWLVFFQGGPGFPSPRPEDATGWLARALKEYRVLLLDQRGTGRSSPVNFQTLARLGGPGTQAEYLMHFRADAIVQDAERIRRELAGGDRRWSALGQSYGGFCIARYLSAAPDGLKEALVTGGLPPLDRPVDDVYRATYRRVADRNRRYYARYPGDARRVQDIAEHLAGRPVELPGGGRLTVRRFQQLGAIFGASNGFERVHYLVENAFVDGVSGRQLSYSFLREVEYAAPFETNPIYALLHEALYCQAQASNWSAQRLRPEYPEFDWAPGQAMWFTGEMIYPWMFDDYKYLQPLKGAADILAAHDGWPRLYDLAALGRNTVPIAAAVYYDDMYVERAFSEETARAIPGMRVWVTNEHDHNALRAAGEAVLDRLLAMLHGEA